MTTKVLRGLDLSGQRIQSVGSPSSANDAATRGWVESTRSDVVWTTEPRLADAGVNGGSNIARWSLVSTGGAVSQIGVRVGTSGGNCSVAAYAGSGSGRNRVPATLLAATGSVACPAAGFALLALGQTVTVTAWRDYLAWWQTTTANVWFAGALDDSTAGGLGAGFGWSGTDTNPFSATIPTLTPKSRMPILVGAP